MQHIFYRAMAKLNDHDTWAANNIIGFIKTEMILTEEGKRDTDKLDWDKIIKVMKDHVPERALANFC